MELASEDFNMYHAAAQNAPNLDRFYGDAPGFSHAGKDSDQSVLHGAYEGTTIRDPLPIIEVSYQALIHEDLPGVRHLCGDPWCNDRHCVAAEYVPTFIFLPKAQVCDPLLTHFPDSDTTSRRWLGAAANNMHPCCGKGDCGEATLIGQEIQISCAFPVSSTLLHRGVPEFLSSIDHGRVDGWMWTISTRL